MNEASFKARRGVPEAGPQSPIVLRGEVKYNPFITGSPSGVEQFFDSQYVDFDKENWQITEPNSSTGHGSRGEPLWLKVEGISSQDSGNADCRKFPPLGIEQDGNVGTPKFEGLRNIRFRGRCSPVKGPATAAKEQVEEGVDESFLLSDEDPTTNVKEEFEYRDENGKVLLDVSPAMTAIQEGTMSKARRERTAIYM